ncbi:MAG: PIG-L family deacetylase [Dehalococcoidia bacterium]|nr:PIG-L family deacetylase [Dehalococcoidia bacterium]
MPVVLTAVAHPDDESYPFGGLLSLLADTGWRCYVLAATVGEAGERHDGGPREALGAARAAELAEACRVLGAEPPITWHLPDGGLAALPSLAEELAALSTTLGADVLLSFGPDGAYGHPDHVAVHRWCRAAATVAGTALLEAAFPPGLFYPQYERCRSAGVLGDPPALRPQDLGAAAAEIELRLPPFLRERKRAAIAAHRSQLPCGIPEALFPPGIVESLLEREAYVVAVDGAGAEAVRRLVAASTLP